MFRPERTDLADGLSISRLVTGLWQVADLERAGAPLDIDRAAGELAAYAGDGFDTFDMADHYGSAELIAGRCLDSVRKAGGRPPVIMTKWVPEPGPMTPEVVRAGVVERLQRLGAASIDLLQFHWWQYEHPGYIDALRELARLRHEGLIRHLGLTNFDTDHLRLLKACGVPIVSNQVCFSLLDRRAAGPLSDYCLASDVRILAFGTLAGGFLSERWLGQPEPAEITDWSKMKYKRFIDAAGGWEAFQNLLGVLAAVARRHQVTLSSVATRWVLDHPAVAAAIIGARLGENQHRADNVRVFSFALDATDRRQIDGALAGLSPVAGDCGDEYRKPPFLTASGDLSHHLASFPRVFSARPSAARPQRSLVDSGSIWEEAGGFCRAVRTGNRVLVSGTTATHTDGTDIAPADAAAQVVYILDKIAASLAAAGAALDDVVRTRIYVRDRHQWEAVAKVHGRYFASVRPANTLVEVAGLVGDYAVEIEAEAEIT